MKLQPELNDYVQAKVSAFASISSTVSSYSPMPRTELDSHANMIVVGKNAFVFSRVIGRTCEVTPFSSELGTVKEVPIVDAAIAYHCQFTNETFVLIVRNALYIHNMDHNLVPPFILREAGVLINDVSMFKSLRRMIMPLSFLMRSCAFPYNFMAYSPTFIRECRRLRRLMSVPKSLSHQTAPIGTLTMRAMHLMRNQCLTGTVI